MDNGVAKVIGGIYIALTGAIGPDAARVAHEKLARFALSPDLPAEDRRVYACITHCAESDGGRGGSRARAGAGASVQIRVD